MLEYFLFPFLIRRNKFHWCGIIQLCMYPRIVFLDTTDKPGYDSIDVLCIHKQKKSSCNLIAGSRKHPYFKSFQSLPLFHQQHFFATNKIISLNSIEVNTTCQISYMKSVFMISRSFFFIQKELYSATQYIK